MLLIHFGLRPNPLREFGRGGEIRTPDPHNPIVVRYQAALRPEIIYRDCNFCAAAPCYSATAAKCSLTFENQQDFF